MTFDEWRELAFGEPPGSLVAGWMEKGWKARDEEIRRLRQELADAQAKLSSLPADWQEDSSLKTWFPITADEIDALKKQLAEATAAKERAEAKCAEIQRLFNLLQGTQSAFGSRPGGYGGYSVNGEVYDLLSAAIYSDNPGQPLLDRLHNLEAELRGYCK